jgi:hypothetical protein
MSTESVDVAVIGAVAGGGVVANELAQSGLRVALFRPIVLIRECRLAKCPCATGISRSWGGAWVEERSVTRACVEGTIPLATDAVVLLAMPPSREERSGTPYEFLKHADHYFS